jgi:hypothetical protein
MGDESGVEEDDELMESPLVLATRAAWLLLLPSPQPQSPVTHATVVSISASRSNDAGAIVGLVPEFIASPLRVSLPLLRVFVYRISRKFPIFN